MIEEHRVRRGLNEWRHLPLGYRLLKPTEVIEPLDVQRMHAEWFCEYPAGAMLIGTTPCGQWFRKRKSK